jgi:Uma2 family endonuclease
MKALKRSALHTFEEFCDLIREDQKADLIDGVIHRASPENTDANEVFVWLITLIYDFVELYELGKVFGSRVAFRLDELNGPEPDIAFVRKGREHLIQRGRVDGPPDLAIEIVCPESIERDYHRKRGQNEKAGVTEYWIVDEIEEIVTLLRLNKRRKYREVKPKNGELHSQVLPGFWIRPEWLFQNPRPKKAVALATILTRLAPPAS